MSDIELRRVGDSEPENNKLPRGVRAMVLGDRVIFVRRMAGQFIPLPEEEQAELRKKHVI